MIHIQSDHHPRRSYCDPQGIERDDLQAPDLPLTPGVEYCPKCESVKRACDHDLDRAARKWSSRP